MPLFPLFKRKKKKDILDVEELLPEIPADDAEPESVPETEGESETPEGETPADESEEPESDDGSADMNVFQDRRELDGRYNSPAARLARGVSGLFTSKYARTLLIIAGAAILLCGGGLFVYSRVLGGRIQANKSAGYDAAEGTDRPGLYFVRAGKTDGENIYKITRLAAGTGLTAIYFDRETPLEEYAALGGISLVNDKDAAAALSCEYAPGSLRDSSGDKLLVFDALPEDTESLRLSFNGPDGQEKVGFGIMFDGFTRLDSSYFSSEPGLVGLWKYKDAPVELKRMDVHQGLARVTLETGWNGDVTDYVTVAPEDITLRWRGGSARPLEGGVKQFPYEGGDMRIGVYDFRSPGSFDGLSVEVAKLFRYHSMNTEIRADELYDGEKSLRRDFAMGRDVNIQFEGMRKQGKKYIVVCHAEYTGGEGGEAERVEMNPDTRLRLNFADGGSAEVEGEFMAVTEGCDIVFDVSEYEERIGYSNPYGIATVIVDGIGLKLPGGSIEISKDSFIGETPLSRAAGLDRVRRVLEGETPGAAYSFSVLDMTAKNGMLYASVAERYLDAEGKWAYGTRTVEMD